MSAREQLTASLQALLGHIDSGAIQDTALPGTPSAEATRLVKNGLAVSAFTSFEHFVRQRMSELLVEIEAAPDAPPFQDLPEGLQLAATRGVIEALRFRMGLNSDDLELKDAIALAQLHAGRIVSTGSSGYQFSPLAFGWARSNISAGTLNEFFSACGARHFGAQLGGVLTRQRFNFAAAGLSDSGQLKVKRLSQWRHSAAHDANHDIDVPVLRTRITAYLALAAAFDFLASLAVRILLDGFGVYGHAKPEANASDIYHLVPGNSGGFELERPAHQKQHFYSIEHCQTVLGVLAMPLNGMVVVRDAADQVVDWFFC